MFTDGRPPGTPQAPGQLPARLAFSAQLPSEQDVAPRPLRVLERSPSYLHAEADARSRHAPARVPGCGGRTGRHGAYCRARGCLALGPGCRPGSGRCSLRCGALGRRSEASAGPGDTKHAALETLNGSWTHSVALSVEHWTWKPQRTLVPPQPKTQRKWSLAPRVLAPQAPAVLLPPGYTAQTAGLAWAWHHPPVTWRSSADPRINNVRFPKCSNPVLNRIPGSHRC